MQKMNLRLQYPLFVELSRDHGGALCPVPGDQLQQIKVAMEGRACHACWYYFCIATKQMEAAGPIEQQTLLEGEPWQDTHFSQQMQSVALLYGVNPDEVTKHWECVEKQCKILELEPPAPIIMQKTRIVVN